MQKKSMVLYLRTEVVYNSLDDEAEQTKTGFENRKDMGVINYCIYVTT
jgi:hypothetical protein